MNQSELVEQLDEAEALARAIADISADSRRMAADLAETITGVAELHCTALDARAETLLKRVAALRERLAA